MAEKRKPDAIFLLRFSGKAKSLKVELFHAGQWGESKHRKQYRIRVHGKWFARDGEKMSFFSQYEFRDLLWRSIKKRF